MWKPLGYQQITDLSSAVGLTIPAGAQAARIQPLTQAVRWRDDGEDPTASVGMQIAAGGELWYTGSLAGISVIEVTSGAELNVSFYG